MPDAWVETASAHVVARHDGRDARDAARLVAELEELRGQTCELLGIDPRGEIALVLHGTPLQLDLAQPLLPFVRTATSTTGRKLVAGWPNPDTIHVLAPRVLRDRASHDGPEERELLRLAPGALLVMALLATAHPKLASRRTLLSGKWAWLSWGAGQLLSGQTEQARGLLRRRLRDSSQPRFPPSLGDAPLLGGTVFELLRREEGMDGVAAFLRAPLPPTPDAALRAAFHGREPAHSAGSWRGLLSRLAEGV
ncbi:MAG: hypothetical protein JHC95_13370 [Solirubrobacteraceae bacterium]|nr:hypothetical protein [Solirubrobacteraceae bacterium]